MLKIRRLDLHTPTVEQIQNFVEKGVKGVPYGDV